VTDGDGSRCADNVHNARRTEVAIRILGGLGRARSYVCAVGKAAALPHVTMESCAALKWMGRWQLGKRVAGGGCSSEGRCVPFLSIRAYLLTISSGLPRERRVSARKHTWDGMGDVIPHFLIEDRELEA
jgi:hypothetical protein